MDDNELIAQRIVQSLSFEVEAVPHKNAAKGSNSKTTPLNVKIKVRKKEDTTIDHGILTVTRAKATNCIPEKIRLVNSDQTILSFDVTMDANFDKKPTRKHRKRILDIFKPGKCLSAQVNDDDYAYLPTSSYNSNPQEGSISTRSDGMLKQHFPLSKRNNDFATSSSYSNKRKIFLGKCKPGGCLDPPFGEDSFSYTPATQAKSISEQNVIKIKPAKMKNDRRNSKYTAAPDSIFFDDNKISLDNSSNVQVVTIPEIDKKSILNIYQAMSINTSLSTTHSNSLITYPPILTSSDVHPNNEKNTKNRNFNPENKSKKSFNEFSDSYFILPKNISNQLTQQTTNKNDLNLLVTKVDDKLVDDIRIINTEGNSENSMICNMPPSFDNKGDEVSIIKETRKLAAAINIDPRLTQPVDIPRDNKDTEARIDKEEKKSISNKNCSQLLSYTGTKLTALEPSTQKLDILSQNSNESVQNKFGELNFKKSFEETIYEIHPKSAYPHVKETSIGSQISVIYKEEDSTFTKYTTNMHSTSGLPLSVEISSLSSIADFTKYPSKQSNLESFKEINDTKEVLRKGDELLKTDYQAENYKYKRPERGQLSPKIQIFKEDFETRSENVDSNEKKYNDNFIKNVDCKVPIQTINNSINHSPEPDIISKNINVKTSLEPSFLLENNLSYESLKIRVSSTCKDKDNQNISFGSEATQQLPPKIENNLFLRSLESDLDRLIEIKDVHTSNIGLQLENNLSIESPVFRADTPSGKVRNLHVIDIAVGILPFDSSIRAENNTEKQNVQSNFEPTKVKDDHNSIPFPQLANKPSTQSLKFKTSLMSTKDKIPYTDSISEGLTHCPTIENENTYDNHSSKFSFNTEDVKKNLIVIQDVLQSNHKLSNESIELKIIPSNTKAEKSYKIGSSSEVSQKYNIIIIEKRNDSILNAITTSEPQVSISIKQPLNTKAEIYPTFKLDEHEQTIPKVDDQNKSVSEISSDLINNEYAVKRNFTDEVVSREQLNNNNNNKDIIVNNFDNKLDLTSSIVKLSDGLLKTEETSKNMSEHISLQENLREESIVNINFIFKETQRTDFFKNPAETLPQSHDENYDIPYNDGSLSIHDPSIHENFETLANPSSNIIINKYKTSSFQQSFGQTNVKHVSEIDLEESIYSANYLPLATFSIENIITELQDEDTERFAPSIVANVDNTTWSLTIAHPDDITNVDATNFSVSIVQTIKKSNSSVNLSVLLLTETSGQEEKNLVEEKCANIVGIQFKSGVEIPIKKTVEGSDIIVIKPIHSLKNPHTNSVTENLDIKLLTSNIEEKNVSLTSYNCNKPTAQHNHPQPYSGSIQLKGTQQLEETNKANKNPVNDISSIRMFELNKAKAPDLYKKLLVEDSIKLRNAQDGIASSTTSQPMATTTSTIKRTQKIDKIYIDFAFQTYSNGNHERILKTYDSAKEPERYMNDTLVIVKSQIKLSHETRIPVDTENDIFIQIRQMTMQEETVGQSKTSIEHSKANLMEEFVEADNQIVVNTKTLNAETKTYNEILYDKLQASLDLIYEQDLVPLQNIIKDLKEEICVLAEQQVSFRDHLFNKKTKSTRPVNPNKRCACLRKYL